MRKSTTRVAAIALSCLVGLTAVQARPVYSQSNKVLHAPVQLPPAYRLPAEPAQEDTLLVMPNPDTENDDLKKALEDADAKVVGTIGGGPMKVLVLRTPHGKASQTEAKLRKDKKDFPVIQRNYLHAPTGFVPNDPMYASEWYIPAVNAQNAWCLTQGQGAKIAVLDSGCQASVQDLSGKTDKGYDAHTTAAHILTVGAAIDPLSSSIGMLIDDSCSSGARTDVTGHGTMVATSAAATDNNHSNGAGVAPMARVVPIHITDNSTAMADDVSIMAAMYNLLLTNKARIVNISYSHMADPGHDPVLHAFFRAFHDKGGIIFVSAGNDHAYMGNGQMDYINVVSAVDPSYNKADFSNWGNCVTFAAPGVQIGLTDRTGAWVSENGTSFASPICAAIAALVWSANPSLSNRQVEQIMKTTAVHTPGGGWTPYFGYGMPDAYAAVLRALGRG